MALAAAAKLQIASIVLILLAASQLAALVVVTIAFSVEIAELKSNGDGSSGEQQERINVLQNQLNSLESFSTGMAQQLDQVIEDQQQASNGNSQNELAVIQQLLEEIMSREQQLESTRQNLFQLVRENASDLVAILSSSDKVRELEPILQMLFLSVLQNSEAIAPVDSLALQVSTSLNLLHQQLVSEASRISSLPDLLNSSLSEDIRNLLSLAQATVTRLRMLGRYETFPAPNCAGLLSTLPSGNYLVTRVSNNSAVMVFCNMTLSCDNTIGGWMLVSVRDFAAGDSCPTGLTPLNISGLTLCSISRTSCTGTFLDTFGVMYNSACGRLVGYQLGTPEAFARSIVISSLTIDSQYLDGWSLTHGSSPRQHIWSFPLGVTETRTDRFGCPCNSGNPVSAPAFVGTDYFCDSTASSILTGMFYPDRAMWTGMGCMANNVDCCSFNDPPWFFKELPQAATDDLELRGCQDEGITTEGAPLESIELYVR